MSLEIMFLDVLAKKKEFILAHKNNISSEGQPPVVNPCSWYKYRDPKSNVNFQFSAVGKLQRLAVRSSN